MGEAAEKAQKEKEAKEAAEKAKKEKEAKEAAEKAKKEKEEKEAAAKLQKEKEVKEEAERAKKARDADQLRTLFQQIDLDGNGVLNFEEFQRAFQAAGGLGDISTAKEVLETAKGKKESEMSLLKGKRKQRKTRRS